jgi:hypothetical protein
VRRALRSAGRKGSQAARRLAAAKRRRLSGDHDEELIPIYSTFHPRAECPPVPNATNATNGTEVVDPRDPNHDGMIIGYEEMFDVWGEYQPLHGIKSDWDCPTAPSFTPFFGYYCPHNNLGGKEVYLDEKCAAKCDGESDKEGAPGTPGFCAGNEDLAATSNALCLPYDACKKLCEMDDQCSGFDMHSDLPRCWLNGPHCDMKAPKGGRMIYESHPDLTFWGKADAEGTFAYTKDSTCGGSGAFTFPTNELSLLHTITATPFGCEMHCRWMNMEGGHCGGFILIPDASKDVKKCHFFVDKACTKSAGEFEWAQDEGEEEGDWDAYYYYPAMGTSRKLSAARKASASAARAARKLHEHSDYWVEGEYTGDELFDESYYYNVYAYYYLSPCPVSGVLGDGGFYDCSTDQWNNYETCDAVCETVLPGDAYVVKFTPADACYVTITDPTDHVGGKYIATSSSLRTFTSDDHAARIQWKGGMAKNCNGWVIAKNEHEKETKMVYTCDDAKLEWIQEQDGVPDDFTTCYDAHGTDMCDVPLIHGFCMHSCHDTGALESHDIMDVELKVKVHYTHTHACPDVVWSGEWEGIAFDNCTHLVGQMPTACRVSEVVMRMCNTACDEHGHGSGVEVTYLAHHHNDFTPMYKSWPAGAEDGFSPEQAAVLLEDSYVEKNGLGPCNTSGNISEIAILDYLKASSEFFEWDTPVAKVSMEYVCGTPPSCPAMTHCVMSDTEFAAEYGRFKGSVPFHEKIAPLPYEERLHMLTSYVWADMLDVQMDKEFAFGKVLSTASQAVLIHRVADINYGKEVFRSAPLHTRVRFVELPHPAHTAVLTVSSPEAQDLLLNFGGSVNPLPGYKPWTGDALRLELFDAEAETAPPTWTEHVKIEIMSPGTTSIFGLKVLTKLPDGKLEDVTKLGAMVEAVDPELGGIGGWFRLTFPGGMLAHAGDFFLTEDIDECAAPELNECETFEDGGECTNTDGGYTCSCRDNFLLVKGQCVQSKWDGGAPQTILAYPQDRLATGWRVNEVRVFEKYDERTKTCFGRCPDGSMSPQCSYGQYIGPGVSSAGLISNVRASHPYPGHYKDFLADGDMSSSWWSRELVVDRAAGTGAWIAFEAESDPQCVAWRCPHARATCPKSW